MAWRRAIANEKDDSLKSLWKNEEKIQWKNKFATESCQMHSRVLCAIERKNFEINWSQWRTRKRGKMTWINDKQLQTIN